MASNFDDVCSQLQRLHDIARVEVILCNLASWRSVLHPVKHLGPDVHDLARQLVDLKRHYPLLGQSVELRLVEGLTLQGVLVSITGLGAQQCQNCIVVVLVEGAPEGSHILSRLDFFRKLDILDFTEEHVPVGVIQLPIECVSNITV